MKGCQFEKQFQLPFDGLCDLVTSPTFKTDFHSSQEHAGILCTDWQPPLPLPARVAPIGQPPSKRVVEFRTPVKGRLIRKFIGTDFTRCVESQQVAYEHDTGCLVLESSTQFFDIPNASAYELKQVMTVSPVGDNTSSVTIQCYCRYSKKMMKSMVERQLLEGSEKAMNHLLLALKTSASRYVSGTLGKHHASPVVTAANGRDDVPGKDEPEATLLDDTEDTTEETEDTFVDSREDFSSTERDAVASAETQPTTEDGESAGGDLDASTSDVDHMTIDSVSSPTANEDDRSSTADTGDGSSDTAQHTPAGRGDGTDEMADDSEDSSPETPVTAPTRPLPAVTPAVHLARARDIAPETPLVPTSFSPSAQTPLRPSQQNHQAIERTMSIDSHFARHQLEALITETEDHIAMLQEQEQDELEMLERVHRKRLQSQSNGSLSDDEAAQIMKSNQIEMDRVSQRFAILLQRKRAGLSDLKEQLARAATQPHPSRRPTTERTSSDTQLDASRRIDYYQNANMSLQEENIAKQREIEGLKERLREMRAASQSPTHHRSPSLPNEVRLHRKGGLDDDVILVSEPGGGADWSPAVHRATGTSAFSGVSPQHEAGLSSFRPHARRLFRAIDVNAKASASSRRTARVLSTDSSHGLPSIVPEALRDPSSLLNHAIDVVTHQLEGMDNIQSLPGHLVQAIFDRALVNGTLTSETLIAFHGIRELYLRSEHRVQRFDAPALEIFLQQNALSLEALEACDFSLLSDNTIRLITSVCDSLKSLHVSGCMITDGAFSLVSEVSLPELQVLDLSPASRLSDESFERVALIAKRLQSLSLANGRHLSDICFMHIIRNCTQLSTLDLSECTSLSSIALQQIRDYLPHIKELFLSGCMQFKTSEVTALLTACRELTMLDLSFCGLAVAPALFKRAKCEDLHTLSLRGCPAVNDMTLKQIATVCTGLEVLNINGCSQVTDEGLSHLGASLSRLADINIARCEQVTDMGAQHLAGGCHALHTLVASQCPNLSESAVFSLATGCDDITHLNLAFANIGDSISQAFPILTHLTALNLRGATRVQCLEVVGTRACPSLAVLNLATCPNLRVLKIDHARLQVLDVSECPSLESVHVRGPSLRELHGTECPKLEEVEADSECLTHLLLSASPEVTRVALGSGDALAGDGHFHLTDQKYLQMLSVNYNKSILVVNANQCPSLRTLHCAHCPKLCTLRIDKSSQQLHTVVANDNEVLESITIGARSSQLIQVFNIADSKQLTQLDLGTHEEGGTRVREITFPASLTSASLERAITAMPSLSAVAVDGCTAFTNDHMDMLCDCEGIRSLTLFKAVLLDDKGFRSVRRLKNLVDFEIVSCPLVTDSGMSYLADCSNLESLEIGCRGISVKALSSILPNCTNLQVVGLPIGFDLRAMRRIQRRFPEVEFIEPPPEIGGDRRESVGDAPNSPARLAQAVVFEDYVPSFADSEALGGSRVMNPRRGQKLMSEHQSDMPRGAYGRQHAPSAPEPADVEVSLNDDEPMAEKPKWRSRVSSAVTDIKSLFQWKK